MVVAELAAPPRELRAKRIEHLQSAIEFNRMALTVSEGDSLDMLIALEGPGQAGGRVLAAGKKNKRT